MVAAWHRLKVRAHVNVRTEYVIEHAGYMTYTLRLRDLRSDTEIHVSDHDCIRSVLKQLRQYPSVSEQEQEPSNSEQERD